MTELFNKEVDFVPGLRKFLEEWYVQFGLERTVRVRQLVEMCVRNQFFTDRLTGANAQAKSKQFKVLISSLLKSEVFYQLVQQTLAYIGGRLERCYGLTRKPDIDYVEKEADIKEFKFNNIRAEETFDDLRSLLKAWYRSFGTSKLSLSGLASICKRKNLLMKTIGRLSDTSMSRMLGSLLRYVSQLDGYDKVVTLEYRRFNSQGAPMNHYDHFLSLSPNKWPIDDMLSAESKVLTDLVGIPITVEAEGAKMVEAKPAVPAPSPTMTLEDVEQMQAELDEYRKRLERGPDDLMYYYKVTFTGTTTVGFNHKEEKSDFSKALCDSLSRLDIVCKGLKFDVITDMDTI